MRCRRRKTRLLLITALGVLADPTFGASQASESVAPDQPEAATAAPTRQAPDTRWPDIIGAQFTYILQKQSTLRSPYEGPLSLNPEGDTQPTVTFGFYFGWAPLDWAQLYFDTEKFNGAGVSNATGLGGLTNGDVVREGAASLPKTFYVARAYLRLLWPLAPGVMRVEAAQDQIGGAEASTRLELKVGRLAVNDDFDRNNYAGQARSQFLNWALWANPAWDYAANTRGFTDGFMIAYVSPRWTLRYGAYLMPQHANGQQLESSFARARGQQIELTLQPGSLGTIVRILGFYNTARMGIYEEALANAAATGRAPDIAANDADGRHKYGWGLNFEQPLADEGNTGLFGRLGWNDGKTEDFAFTEVDRHASFGAQICGSLWQRPEDRLGVAGVIQGLSGPHRDYLAAGGIGFLLGDGRLDYAHEKIFETYYRFELKWPFPPLPSRAPHEQPRLQLSPDFQYISNPGFNADRGPVHFWGIRVHLEY